MNRESVTLFGGESRLRKPASCRLYYLATVWVVVIICLTPLISGSSDALAAATQQDMAASSNVWPTESVSMRYNPSHNAVWGSAVDSNINWTFNALGDMPFTDVIVVDGLAYFGSMMNNVYALNAVTGKLVWKFMANNWVMTDPVVADGKIFVGSGNRNFQNPHLRGTGSNSLYALDAKTGKQLWEYSVPGEAMPTPVYNKGMVYFVTGDGGLYALDANTGKLSFKIQSDSYFSMSSPALDGNLLFAGGATTTQFYAFDISTQKISWIHPFLTTNWAIDDCSPTIDNNTVFTEGAQEVLTDPFPPPTATLHAMDEQTGALKWSFDMGSGTYISDNKCGTPMVKDGVVYAGSPITKNFYAVDENTGNLRWQYKVGVPIRGAAVVQGKYVLFNDIKGTIYVLNAANGSLVTTLKLGGTVSPGGMGIYNGTVYVANQNGKVMAFPLLSLIKKNYTATQPKPAQNVADSTYFSETGHAVSGDFLSYWQQHGGVAQFGYPLTETFQRFNSDTGLTSNVQYFERARFEEVAGGSSVELGLLGVVVTKGRSAEVPFRPLKAASPNSDLNTHYFSATSHSLTGDFWTYWQANGGLARFGYPLSEPFLEKNPDDGKTYTVQYFERARFELHPEVTGKVELGQLGRQVLAGS